MKQIKLIAFTLLVLIIFGFTSDANRKPNTDPTMNLDTAQQSIITIASLTAKGDLKNLEMALVDGLESGLTINEIKEIMVHLYAYCGFPRSLRGLRTFIKVLDERKEKGIVDNLGAEASPIQDNRSKYDQGKANLEA